MTEIDDAELARHFEAARARPPRPDDALMQRAVAQAHALQPRAAEPTTSRPGSARLWAWLGAAAMPSGLVAATLVGVWIGISGGDTLADRAAGLMQTDLGLELVYRFPAMDGFLEEI